jgi:hypothetical protein
MTKAFGRDINEYYNNHFPEDRYLEYYTEEYEKWLEFHTDDAGDLHLPADQKFELKEFGDIYEQNSNTLDRKLGSFESLFKRWLKSQSTTTVVLEVAKDEYEGVVAKLKGLGLKVIK